MASCDAILWHFDYICSERPPGLYELLERFDGLVNVEGIVGKVRRAMGAYLGYYRKINRMEQGTVLAV